MSRFRALKENKPVKLTEAPPEDEKRTPGRRGKKFVGGWFSKEMVRELHHIAVDQELNTQQMVGEALDLFLIHYGHHPRNER